MDQSSQDAWLCQTFEVSAGFAEPRSAQADGSDLELLTHEMIQRHASGDYVPSCCPRRNRKALFALQRFGCVPRSVRKVGVTALGSLNAS